MKHMKIGSKDFDFAHQVYVMGILNVTPDSFSDGGSYVDPEKALDHALQMESEGADMIDVGGESTRPGSEPVSADEELKRILPVLKKIIPRLKCPVSVDTYKASVAHRALEEGVSLINDISSLADPEMGGVVVAAKVPIILMHMQGSPKTMQKNIFYKNVVEKIFQFLEAKIQQALSLGIREENILLDPGIGFGKRFEDNLAILQHLEAFRPLKKPLVFGASRKSFIRQWVGERPEDILKGSLLAATLAAQRGASLLRVHDVGPTRGALRNNL